MLPQRACKHAVQQFLAPDSFHQGSIIENAALSAYILTQCKLSAIYQQINILLCAVNETGALPQADNRLQIFGLLMNIFLYFINSILKQGRILCEKKEKK